MFLSEKSLSFLLKRKEPEMIGKPQFMHQSKVVASAIVGAVLQIGVRIIIA